MPDVADPPEQQQPPPASQAPLVDARAVVDGIFARLPQVLPPAPAPAPAKVESQFEKVKERLLQNENVDRGSMDIYETLLNAKIADSQAAIEARQAAENAKTAEQQSQRAMQERSNQAMAEVDKMIARFGADHPLVTKSRIAIKDNVAKAFDSDPNLVARFQRGDVDYAALERLTLKEINEYLPEGQRKSPGGPAIKNDAPSGAKVTPKVDEDNLDEKGREFVTAQVNYFKKQPGYTLEKAKEKALDMYAKAEERKRSRK